MVQAKHTQTHISQDGLWNWSGRSDKKENTVLRQESNTAAFKTLLSKNDKIKIPVTVILLQFCLGAKLGL
jgi:hypothetical protein